jgi:hypothetical protein
MNKQEADKIALSIYNKKQPIIKYVKKEFKRLYNGVVNDMSKLIANNTFVTQNQIVDNYKTDIMSIIKIAYRMTSDKFDNNIRSQINIDNTIKKSKIDFENSVDAKIDHDITLFINNQSEKQADFIANTLATKVLFYKDNASIDYDKNIDNLQQTIAELSQDKLLTNNNAKIEHLSKQIALAENELQKYKNDKNIYLARLFQKKFIDNVVNQMSNLDAEQEVNYAESSVRDIEARGLVNSQEVIAGGIYAGYKVSQILYKQWNSALDNKTRTGHAMAYGQTVLATELFQVANLQGNIEFGMMPRADTFSIGNKINCRCVAIYFLKK